MKQFILIIFTIIISSCATSKFVQTGNTFPPYLGIVKVFRNEIPKNIKYEEIGMVSSSGGMIHEWTDLIEAIQKEAAEYGANAILIGKGEKSNFSSLYSNQSGTTAMSSPQKSLTAIAIRILE